MEHLGAIDFEGQWSSMNGMCSDEADFMAQLLGNFSFPNDIAMYEHDSASFPFSPSVGGDDPHQFLMNHDVINAGSMGSIPELPSQPENKKRSRIPENHVNISNKKRLNKDNKSSSSSSCCSEDDSIKKTRAGRGSATDPQSLYARKRREKINERLKTLQKLVPNGTKVDISTMLEDAVDYVKFLQHQIKLLSSDDLWMYAPIATMGWDKLQC